MSWTELVVNNDYEIFTEFPYQIKKKSNGKIIKEWIHKSNYVICKLNKHPYYKHRIIAIQFIPNPDNLPEIEHINTIRNDNRIENLRFCTHSTNSKNRTSYKNVQAIYINELPIDSIQILNHNNHSFNDYYIDREANIYRYNGARYYKLTIDSENKVHMMDVNNKSHHFSINGLIRAFL